MCGVRETGRQCEHGPADLAVTSSARSKPIRLDSSRSARFRAEVRSTASKGMCRAPCPTPLNLRNLHSRFKSGAPPLFLGPFRSDGQQVCSTPRTRTGWWRIPAAASDLTQDLHRCVAIEEPRQGGAGRLSSAPTNERTKPGRRGDRVSFQYACDRCTSPQGSRTASTGAKKSPSIASCSHCQGSSPSRSR